MRKRQSSGLLGPVHHVEVLPNDDIASRIDEAEIRLKFSWLGGADHLARKRFDVTHRGGYRPFQQHILRNAFNRRGDGLFLSKQQNNN